MPLSNILNNFRDSITEANGFITLAFQQDAVGRYILPKNQQDFITDSAFLKIFIAWEAFLEGSFIEYMMGEASILGSVVTRHVQPVDASHASKLLIGTQKYVDWSNPEIVKKLSNLYFGLGNPIDIFISSMMTDLFDLKTVRNAAAHLTSTTQTQLDSLATRKLRRHSVNFRVSDYIFSIDPTSITGDTILTTYLNSLDVSSEGIANG